MIQMATKANVAAAFMIACMGIVLHGAWIHHAASSANAQPQIDSDSANAAEFISRFGYGAAALAAVGATPSDATATIAEIAELDFDLESLLEMQMLRNAADEAVSQIQSSIWRGGASPGRLSALLTAEANRDVLQASVDEAENALRIDIEEVFLNRFNASGMALISRLNANRDRRIPDHFKALDLNESEWSTLEAACVKNTRGLALAGAESLFLAQCQSNQLAILVASRLATNLAPIETVFDAAFAPEE